MVQIIQSGPSQATLRQQALNDALSTAISGYAAYQDKQEKKALTDRQKALDTFSNVLKMREAGYDVGAADLEAAIAKPESIADIFSRRTPEYEAKKLTEASKLEREAKEFEQRSRKAEAEIKNLEASAGIDSEKKRLEIQKIKEDLAMSPIARRKAAAEAGKLERETSGAIDPRAKLAKLGAESQNKIGGIVTALDALEALKGSTQKGFGPRRINPDFPIVGSFVSDDPYSAEERVVTEVVGRLQSGGAINDEEGRRFKEMGPRPGDTPQISAQKIDAQKRFLENKMIALGIRPEEASALGFNVRGGETGNTDSVSTKQSGQVAPLSNKELSRLEELRAKKQQAASR